MGTKVCTKCRLKKNLLDFPFKHKARNIRNSVCKVCQREYKNDYYRKNSIREMKRNMRRKNSIRQWINDYKKSSKCSKCGNDHPAVLDFHHINPKHKEIDVIKASDYGWGIKRILKEIKKCLILCSNCHRILHWSKKYGM